jgi:hypothetical protein
VSTAQNSDETAAAVLGRPFPKGASGNPGGRPKGLAKATRALVGEDGKALVDFWWRIVQDEKARTADRLAASKLLAERGWGKAADLAPPEDAVDEELKRLEVDEAVKSFTAEVERLAVLREVKTAAA